MLLKIIKNFRYKLVIIMLLVMFSSAVFAQSAVPPVGASPAEELSFWEELAFWEAVKDSKNPAELEAYLETYPEGRFATLARVRIRILSNIQNSNNTAADQPANTQDSTASSATASTSTTTEASTAAQSQPDSTTPSTSYYIATTNSNVRSEPSTRAERIGLIREGDRVLVLGEETDGWYKVQLNDGNIAYIFASLLQPEEPANAGDNTAIIGGETDNSAAIEATTTTPAADGTLSTGEVFQDCVECPQMVVIPSGQFMMGSEKERSEEKPAHQVDINEPFALSVFEVSYQEWQVCMKEGGCRYDPGEHVALNNTSPVSDISWDDAQSYVKWLSAKTGEVYRLPSEAEWEYAARAGTTTTYSWGDDTGAGQANCQGCGSQWDNQQAAPVGSFQANPFGLYDMHGNIWEWTADCWNSSYRNAPADGSAWLKGDCLARVLRSGSWKQEADYMRAARRSWYDRDVRYYLHGMRVAKTLR